MQILQKPETAARAGRIPRVGRIRQGFTLLEVLLVLAILIAIAAMVVPNIVGAADEANKDTTRLNIKAFEAAAQMYKIKNKVWPEGSTEDVVMLLMMTEDDRGNPTASFIEKIPMDAWGEPLQYQYPADGTGNTFKPLIYSFGPDRDEGGSDNISNIDDLIEQNL
jgi:general secretion pathway protein G